jgi:hypothetical protein
LGGCGAVSPRAETAPGAGSRFEMRLPFLSS